MLEHLPLLKDLRDELLIVDACIDEYLQTDKDTGVIAEVFDSVRSTRGKMVRPILLLLSARFGPNYKESQEKLCKLGALVEIIHMASLVHDDIIDDSPMRRRKRTVQSRFGKDMAVFAGDFMISRVMYHIDKEKLNVGITISRTIEDMCRGELGQMVCRWNTDTTIDAYMKNIYGKTVSLFVAAVQIGAFESGCTERDINYLVNVAEHIGYMFQLRDDLLDFVSDERQEGKPVHKDFSDGIYTMPVLYALGKAVSGGRLREIAALRADISSYVECLAEMGELVYSSGGLEFTWTQIKRHAVQAKMQLLSLPHSNTRTAINQIISKLGDSDVYPVHLAQKANP